MNRRVPFILLLLIALGYSAIKVKQGSETTHPGLDKSQLTALLQHQASYQQDVKPILERRCVVCHGCYDAPCQLKLSSGEGIQRGASKTKVYNPTRLEAIPPSRLYIDAQTSAEWRKRGFHPVIDESNEIPEAGLNTSVLYHLLRLKQQNPQPDSGQLPSAFTLELDRDEVCPTLDEIDSYEQQHPLWGMPYAMPNLSAQEYRTLLAWLAQGSKTDTELFTSPEVSAQIKRWETFLNRPDNKQQLVSRYLYEHLFHAHIHFTNTAPGTFYRLVRSTTPPGQAINEIPTVRPYDDPGNASFYYRLRRYLPSIVIKNHIVYEFSDQRLQRYQELFFEPDYEVRKLPSYQPELTANPFKTFIDLPVKSRYRFLLDDARFFIEGFVKGPVCRGQVALSVIEDRFWVLFLDPEQPLFTNDAGFLGETADDLQLPVDSSGLLNPLSIWTRYWQRQRRYMETKQSMFETIGTHDIQHAMNFIWDGDGQNPSASLTVFRHFDSGSVAYGLIGDYPETTWVIDYPLLERIHYLLVAGFDVYGNLTHQANTRIYMDFLRMEGEDHFLAFLPANQREAIRNSWYAGLRTGVKNFFTAPQAWLQVESVTGYRSQHPQQELYTYIQKRVSAVASKGRHLNHCDDVNCNEQPLPAKIMQALQQIAAIQGERLHVFPDVAFVRIRMNEPGEDLAFSLIRNKAYKNVISAFTDENGRDRSDIEQDTLTVVNWLEGAYPNFFFSVAESDIEAFAQHCAQIQNMEDYKAFAERYGIRRTQKEFWKLADWFQDRLHTMQPVRGGLLDLNRYENR